MKRRRIIGFIIGLLMPMALWAQTPNIAVISQSQVSVGEQFKIAFEANADGKKFTAPSFNGFTVVGGPFNSTSSSVQIVNGSMSRTVKNTYSYILRAEREGEFTIGSASMVVDGETVQSQPFKITVVAGNAATGSTSQGTQQSGGQTQPPQQSTNDPTP